MSSARLTALSVVAAALLSAGDAGAKEAKPEDALPRELQNVPLRSVLPDPLDGRTIAESDRPWAYAAAVIGFLVFVGILTEVVIPLVAGLIIVLLALAGIVLLCGFVSDGFLKTWPALALTTLCVAGYFGFAIATVKLFTFSGSSGTGSGTSQADHQKLSDALAAQTEIVNRLSREVAELKRKLPAGS